MSRRPCSWCWDSSAVPTVLSNGTGSLCPVSPSARRCSFLPFGLPSSLGMQFCCDRAEAAEIPTEFLNSTFQSSSTLSLSCCLVFPVVMVNLCLCLGLASGRLLLGLASILFGLCCLWGSCFQNPLCTPALSLPA